MPERVVSFSEARAKLTQSFVHTVLGQVDDYCAYLSHFQGQYRFHKHAKDEMYVVLQGEVLIEYENAPSVLLRQEDTLVVKAGQVHRSSSQDGALVLMFKAMDLFAE